MTSSWTTYWPTNSFIIFHRCGCGKCITEARSINAYRPTNCLFHHIWLVVFWLRWPWQSCGSWSVNTDPLTDQCPLHFYILRILAHLYISAPSLTQPTCWYQVHASHYLLKLIERPSLMYCAMYYWPTVGIRCAWHWPICRYRIHTRYMLSIGPPVDIKTHLASAHLSVSDAYKAYLIPTGGLMPSMYLMPTDGPMPSVYLTPTDGPMPSASDTNRWANAERVSDTNGWADVHLPSAHLLASSAHLPLAYLSVSDAYLPLAHLLLSDKYWRLAHMLVSDTYFMHYIPYTTHYQSQ